jgi:sugar transferase (PEP-CTERM system associated)
MLLARWRTLVLILGETSLLLVAVGVGAYVRLGTLAWPMLSRMNDDGATHPAAGFLRAGVIVLVCQLCLHYSDLYDLRTIVDVRDLLVRLFQALGAASLILALVYYWFPEWIIGRGVFLVAAALVITLVVGWRLAFAWLTRRVPPREKLLLVGTNPASVDLARELHERRQELGVEIIGFVDPDPDRVGSAVINPGVVGTIEDIPELVRTRGADRVVVSLADARGRLPMDRLLDIRLRTGVSFHHLASVYEEYTGKIALENLRPSWLIFASGFSKSRVLMVAKRLLDTTAAAVGLVVALPVLALVAILVKWLSPGPIFYHQERVGLNGQPFTVHKFRTMRVDAEAGTGPVWAAKNDDRITPLGRFLRRTRLDELPQLWNVLKGDMSLVGPRPERPTFVEHLTETIPFYGQRHVVKPGLTGWAQIRYTYGASVEDAVEKLQYDLYYIKNMSLALDLVILLETMKTVVLRRGAQ